MLPGSHALRVRQAKQTDVVSIRRLFHENWAAHLRILPEQIDTKLKSCIALLAEDDVNLRGVLLVEPHAQYNSLIIGLAIHDNSHIDRILTMLLPALIPHLIDRDIRGLMQVGFADWLTQLLPEYGFQVKDKIITYEWHHKPLPNIRSDPHLEIRSGHISDIPALYHIDQAAFGPFWHKPQSIFREGLGWASLFSVGVLDDNIVAYVWCDQYESRGHVTRIATHPNYQGRGIGTQLLHDALKTMRKLDLPLITLNTQAGNERSQALYERFGFRRTADVIEVYFKAIDDGLEA